MICVYASILLLCFCCCKWCCCLRDINFAFISIGLADSVASTSTYPIQVIKSRLQQRSQALEILDTGKIQVVHREYSGILNCVKRIWAHEGFSGFFKGCVPNALRVAPSAAITFVTYEGVMDMIVGYDNR